MSDIRQWHCLSGILCFILPLQSHHYPVTQQDVPIVDAQFLFTSFYAKLSQTSKMHVKKSILVSWTGDGSDLICSPPVC